MNLRALRTSSNLTQKQCAERFGASQPTWSRLEARAALGGPQVLGPWLWARALGCVLREAAAHGRVAQMQFDMEVTA